MSLGGHLCSSNINTFPTLLERGGPELTPFLFHWIEWLVVKTFYTEIFYFLSFQTLNFLIIYIFFKFAPN